MSFRTVSYLNTGEIMKNYIFKGFVILALGSLMQLQIANAASATADAKQVVTAAISITKASDLDFGTAAQGDVAKTVAPGVAEDASNASFTVAGTPNSAYTITLPANGAVTLQTGLGGANETITVSNFASFPATTGTIGAGGNQLLLVGAQRAALGAAQVVGNYTATFTVTVVY